LNEELKGEVLNIKQRTERWSLILEQMRLDKSLKKSAKVGLI